MVCLSRRGQPVPGSPWASRGLFQPAGEIEEGGGQLRVFGEEVAGLLRVVVQVVELVLPVAGVDELVPPLDQRTADPVEPLAKVGIPLIEFEAVVVLRHRGAGARGPQADAADRAGNRQAQGGEDGGEDILQPHRFGKTPPGRPAGVFDQQGNFHPALVEFPAVEHQLVFTKVFAVVAGDDDHARIVKAPAAQVVKETAQLTVEVADLTVILGQQAGQLLVGEAPLAAHHDSAHLELGEA